MPLYDSLGENAVEYIVGHSEAKFIFTSSAKLATLAKALPTFAKQIKTIVYWGPENKAAVEVHHLFPLHGDIESFLGP